MTQAEIARRIGEDHTWVNSRVRGFTEIKADDVPRFATALGVQPRAFFETGPAPARAQIQSVLVRDRLRELLREKHWSQSELARRLGKHRVWVHYRVTGVTEIKADEIPALAQALGVPPHAFFESRDSAVAPTSTAKPTPEQMSEAEREFILGLSELLTRYRERVGGEPDHAPPVPTALKATAIS
ncbi:MAG TPA: helix-turn-helix transcriptional regulator [Chloroflexota bacterium]|nr:helix-turn-helix transcriptional regulator [Chloroflexota bacterium]